MLMYSSPVSIPLLAGFDMAYGFLMGPMGSQEIYTKPGSERRKVFARHRRLLCNLSERITMQSIDKGPTHAMSSRIRISAKQRPDPDC